MTFTEGQRKLLAYWGTIVQSVTARASTAELWSAVKNAVAAEGLTLGGVRMTDMNALRSIAAGQRVAMETFGRAPDNTVVTDRMLGRDLSSRSANDQLLAPRWLVRFEHSVEVEGETVTKWRSSFFSPPFPALVGGIRDQVEEDAQALADDYDETHVGVGSIQIVAV